MNDKKTNKRENIYAHNIFHSPVLEKHQRNNLFFSFILTISIFVLILVLNPHQVHAAATTNLIFQDTFDNLTTGNLASQNSWVGTDGNTTNWVVQNSATTGKQIQQTNAGATYYQSPINQTKYALKDVRIVVDFQAQTGVYAPQLWLRRTTTTSSARGYDVFYDTSLGQFVILYINGSTLTTLATYNFSPVNGTWYTAEFEAVNDSAGHPVLSFWVYLQGAARPSSPQATITDTADNITGGGYAGLGSHSTTAIYDTFLMYTGDALSAPGSPISLAAAGSAGSDGTINLSWSPPSSNGGLPIIDYTIEYKLTSGSSWTSFSHSASAVTSVTVTGLTQSTSYDFRVSTINTLGTSAPTALVSARTFQTAIIFQDTFDNLTTGNLSSQNNWTGTDGNTTNWVVQNSATTGKQIQQTNAGATYYQSPINQTTYALKDVRIVVDFQAQTGVYAPQLWLRRTTTTSSARGYDVFYDTSLGQFAILYVNGSSFTNLATYSFAFTNGTWYTAEFEAVNDSAGHPVLSFWIYLQGAARPSSPQATITDTTDNITGGGYAGLGSHSTTAIYDTFLMYTGDTIAAPGVPTALTTDVTSGNNTIDLSWTAPSSNGGSAIIDYLVEYKPTSASSWTPFSHSASAATSMTVTGLTNATSYDFRVFAINTIGTGSASTIASAIAQTAVLVPTPTFLLRFNGDFVDSSPNANNGVSTNAAIGSDATRGQVVSLNGSNAYVTVNASLPTSFTKIAWVKLATAAPGPSCGSGGHNIISNGSGGLSNFFWIASDTSGGAPGNFTLRTGQFPGGVLTHYAWDTVTFPVNTWVHTAVTFDASTRTYQLYKNGIVVGSGVASVVPLASGSEQIGAYGALCPLNGFIDDAGMWNKALRPVQIAAIFGGNLGLAPTVPGTLTGLTAVPGNGQIDLSWTAPGNGNSAILGYLLEYKSGDGFIWTTWSEGLWGTTSATITGLTNGATYDFRVSAVNAIGAGPISGVVSATPASAPATPYYYYILSAGQSLSTGFASTPILSSTQPYNNLMFSPGVEGSTVPLIPLVESGAGENGAVETPSSGLANSLRAAGTNNRPVIIGLHGHNATLYAGLAKGSAYYNQGITQITNAKNHVQSSLSGTFLPIAITVAHGESDYWANLGATYESNLVQWQKDYQNDISNLMGGTISLPMFVSQMNTGMTGELAVAQLNAHKNNPGKIILVGPKYQYAYTSDNLHLTGSDSEQSGEMFAKVIKKVVFEGKPWNPLMPTVVVRSGNSVVVSYAIPFGKLAIDTGTVAQRTNYGFEFTQTGGNNVSISSVELVSSSTQARIILSDIPTGANPHIRYAWTCLGGYKTSVFGICGGAGDATRTGGNIRDTDASISPAIGSTGLPLYDWSVSFDEAVIVDNTPPIITAVNVITASTTSNTTRITWITDESASSQVEYGITNAYTASTTEADFIPRLTSHGVNLSGLAACTTYHYRVWSKDAGLNTAISADSTFSTIGCAVASVPTTVQNTNHSTASSNAYTNISVGVPSWSEYIGASSGSGLVGFRLFTFVLASSTGSTTIITVSSSTIAAITTCAPYLKGYMRLGAKNNSQEVKKLQTFLNTTYKGASLTVDGVYKQIDVNAVSLFQLMHPDILKSANLPHPNGQVYALTQKAINTAYCQADKKIFCPYFSSNLKEGSTSLEVLLVKLFLNQTQHESFSLVSQLFNKTVTNAVKKFQQKYRSQILIPSGLNVPNGNWYPLTRKKADEIIGCF